MHLMRLVYYSENRLDPTDGSVLHALQGILSVSKRNNAKRGITGALAFDNFWFFQALEGERDAVWSAFTTIMDDTRHGDVTLAECVPMEMRLFGTWSMRLAMRNADTDALFEPFMVKEVVRPNLMSGSDIVKALLAMTHAGDKPRPRAASALVGDTTEGACRQPLPGSVQVAP